MPLPKSALGPAAASFSLAYDSGRVSNAKAAPPHVAQTAANRIDAAGLGS